MRGARLLSVLSVVGMAGAGLFATGPAQAATSTTKPDCSELAMCTEVANPQEAFGNYYVGHDEPSLLFYSQVPGSGNRAQFQLTIPTEPSGPFSQTKGYNFELNPAFLFGMAMCDTYSFPEQQTNCHPDSDQNIVDPSQSATGPGAAFMELQFYPPGWVQQFNGNSCDAKKWCVALNIDSLSEDPINGTTLNASCQNQLLGGIEYINFAYLTLDGDPLGPPNPLQFDPATSGYPYTKGGRDTLFLNQGDRAVVTLTDTENGFRTTVKDLTTGQTGFMTANAENGFGHIKYDPTGTSCQMVPYTFHPMYSTSSPKTRVLWAAHNYNVAFDSEVGHFDFCTSIDANGNCNGLEGVPGDQETADGDDQGCFPAAASLLYPATGCPSTNSPGFDGVNYQKGYWPDGTANTPTPILFSSPRTGEDFETGYSQFAFEADLPRIEAADLGGNCVRSTGANCVNPPPTDDGTPAPFYPYYSLVSNGPTPCSWGIGATLPNTINDFGGNSTAEYGPLYLGTYWKFGGNGAISRRYNNFNSGPISNTCNQGED